MPAFERPTAVFYARVRQDPILSPLFAHASPEHPAHVAAFIAEVFGGPAAYTARGGHPEMVRRHLGRALTEVQRRRWAKLLAECADEGGLLTDPELRYCLCALR